MDKYTEAKRTRHPVVWMGDIGNEDLEKLADNLINVLSTARYSRKYDPIREDELSTGHGRCFLSWLRNTLELTPFGVSYICEDKKEKYVKVDLGNGDIRESKLFATAGIYAIHHLPDLSLVTTDVGIVASFEDLIKVYSLRNIKKNNPRWDSVGQIIKQKKGENEMLEYKSGKLVKNGRPICYEYLIDQIGTNIFIRDLEFTGFPCYINQNNPRVICLGNRTLY
ncbi:hypothetical protein COV11_04105 [Candidatus Woesearchaeota archaeon CG10_big_fil_rev_8_21_14_0_10_30_7]|nr:MAG: hypothetical protein COV11_04105 [Candidatus Woesearchaeota archaeon CG10_big_fil_rev_8_21_14_0_10_30_7]